MLTNDKALIAQFRPTQIDTGLDLSFAHGWEGAPAIAYAAFELCSGETESITFAQVDCNDAVLNVFTLDRDEASESIRENGDEPGSHHAADLNNPVPAAAELAAVYVIPGAVRLFRVVPAELVA